MAAAHVALGIGEIQARQRRVAICDLVGDVAPLHALVDADDPHGIVDAFQYGVSLNKIAYRIDETDLYIMPSGSEPVLDEEILGHDRWRRLSGGFREVGALLLLVAPAGAAGLPTLIEKTNGVVIAGEGGEIQGPLLATAKYPRHRPSAGAERRRAPRPQRSAYWIPVLGAAVVLAVVIAIGLRASRPQVEAAGVPLDTTEALAPLVDSFAVAPPPLPIPAFVDDPADSAIASAWAVELVKLNTLSGAILKLQSIGRRVTAVTFSPMLFGPDDAQWFVILAGAYREKSAADSLLTSLRAQGVLERNVAYRVARVPYALLLEAEVTRESAPAVVRAYVARDLPAYALVQDDGSARVFAGAFESAEQAAQLAPSVEAAGIRPVVVFRTGRPF